MSITAIDPANAADRCLAVAHVDPWDFLYIRQQPDHRSDKAGAIAPNSKAPIVVTGGCTPPKAGPRRQWCPIDYYVTRNTKRSGYVKMYYTKTVKCPENLNLYTKAKR